LRGALWLPFSSVDVVQGDIGFLDGSIEQSRLAVAAFAFDGMFIVVSPVHE
jgi:hypothetical protein